MQKVVDHFSRRCRAVRLVPFDPHLEEGAEISLDRLRRETREALIELAAVVADGFRARSGQRPDLNSARLLRAGIVPVAEPAQEIRVVVRADRARLGAGRGAGQPPADVGQTGQDETRSKYATQKPPWSEYTRRR